MSRRFLSTVALALMFAGSGMAQFGRGGGGWSTAGGDPQRTGWVRADPQISKDGVTKGVVQFLWKTKLDNTPRQLESLTPPAVTGRVITYKGFKDLMFVSGSSDTVWSIDHPLGKVFWESRLPYAATYPQQKGGTAACPGGLTAAVALASGGGGPGGPGGRGGRGGDAAGPGGPGAGRGGRGGDAAGPDAGRGAPGAAGAGRGGDAAGPGASRGGRGGRSGRGGDAVGPDAGRGAPGAAGAGRGGDAAGPGAGRGAPGAGGPGGGFGGARMPAAVYALSSDGLFHTLNQHTGDDIAPAYKFIRPNALARGLVVVDNMAYVATTGGCGGAPNGVWAMDLTANIKELSTVKWLSGSANIEGAAGLTLGAPGMIYAATGNGPHDPANGEFGRSVVALDQTTLKLKDWFTPAGEAWFKTAPAFFNYKEKDYIAVAGQERIYLLEAGSLGGSDHKTPLFATEPISPVSAGKGIVGALATWQDGGGVRWILAPVAGAVSADAKNGGIVAYKLVEQNGKPTLQPGWTSRDLVSPAAPIVVNGVVFALSSGENLAAVPEQRAQRSSPAALYALDATTGKEMWSSGRTITGFSHSGGLASSASKVFVSTYDGNLYAFGYLLNRD